MKELAVAYIFGILGNLSLKARSQSEGESPYSEPFIQPKDHVATRECESFDTGGLRHLEKNMRCRFF